MLFSTMHSLGSKGLSLIHPEDNAASASFAEDVRRGLQSAPKSLPCRYFYDAQGSRLFERICALPEYYLTRTEHAILNEHADAMVAGWSQPPVVIELGSGSSSKSRRLIAACLRAYGRLHYVPIDVSPTMLGESAQALVREFARLRVTGCALDYQTALTTLVTKVRDPKLIVFLGSSLGNYESDEAVTLLRTMASTMGASDRLLLGTDLDKDPARLEAAYDDAQGVTARFNKNLLARINRELGGDFDLEQFDHQARYHPERRRVEIHLVSRVDQTVSIPAAGLTVRFRQGEAIHTENSQKYTPELLESLAARSGFVEDRSWTDDRGDFQVQRWRRRSHGFSDG